MKSAKYLMVEAQVRYWDDAEINGERSESGDHVPFKFNDVWVPVINIETGEVMDWPKDTKASFHFKVCDAGSYFLLDENNKKIASRFNNYVPSGLCHGDQGYGDYIIFNVGTYGKIENYRNAIDYDEFEIIPF